MLRNSFDMLSGDAWSRRRFLGTIATAPLLAACLPEPTAGNAALIAPRLRARPIGETRSLDEGRLDWNVDGTAIITYLPASARARTRVPLMLFLHGADRLVEPYLDAHLAIADELGVCVAAPLASFLTWDAMSGGFGPDVIGIDRALTALFGRLPVDPQRITLSGFSDGATYALALGRANGDLFRRVVAYAPGGLLSVATVDRPHIAISHGTTDPILSYERTANGIVPTLRTAGYDVTFESFEGGHAVLRRLLESEMRVLG